MQWFWRLKCLQLTDITIKLDLLDRNSLFIQIQIRIQNTLLIPGGKSFKLFNPLHSSTARLFQCRAVFSLDAFQRQYRTARYGHNIVLTQQTRGI